MRESSKRSKNNDYSRATILETIDMAINRGDISRLYQKAWINRIGKPIDSEEGYTEIIAGRLIENGIVDKLQNISPINRNKYKTPSHYIPYKKRARLEEKLAKDLYLYCRNGKRLNGLGRIFDFQVPLKKSQSDKKVGKIDLVSYNEDENSIYLIELKRQDNEETLLRCCLEIATYYELLDFDKFKTSFKFNNQNPDFKKAVLIFKDSKQHKELKQAESNTNIKRLIKALNVHIFVFDYAVTPETI